MHKPLRYELLEQAVGVVERCRPLVDAIQRKDRDAEEWSKDHDLASQIRRAASSVVLNTAEAFGTAGGNARLRFETARGSLYETQAGIRTAVAWGYFASEQTAELLAAMEDLGGRLYGLSRR